MTFLINSPFDKDTIWDKLPYRMQKTIVDKKIKLFVIDATDVARKTGMPGRINTIMQTCFFALSGVLPPDEAIAQIKHAIEKTYYKKGKALIEQNFKAVDQTLENLFEVQVRDVTAIVKEIATVIPDIAPDFVKNVTSMMMSGEGDLIPLSAMPMDGTYLSGTTKWEKRNISDMVATWDADLCIQCGNCSSKVKIKNQTNGMEMTYTLVAENEANLKEGKISIDSPIGKGLLGKKVGDTADVKVPSGIVKFEIVEITR